jgi:hypothetical protein
VPCIGGARAFMPPSRPGVSRSVFVPKQIDAIPEPQTSALIEHPPAWRPPEFALGRPGGSLLAGPGVTGRIARRRRR